MRPYRAARGACRCSLSSRGAAPDNPFRASIGEINEHVKRIADDKQM